MTKTYFQNFHVPAPDSHKGQNGKLLLIGGSELFHAASKWSLDIASKFVDMVFYSSVPINNELIKKAKAEFWNGIVVPRDHLESYITEADVILIGPGMDRSSETETIVNELLEKHAGKKWVIDAGALQMVNPKLLTAKCIVTPHQKEFADLLERTFNDTKKSDEESAVELSRACHGMCVVVKGVEDWVVQGEKLEKVAGGNAGMTKGGTGDVLAGLIAALYCTNSAMTAAVVGSFVNKKAGESLYQKVGPFFNSSDLVSEIPQVLWKELQR